MFTADKVRSMLSSGYPIPLNGSSSLCRGYWEHGSYAVTFARQEYLGRVERIREEMHRRKLAAVLIDDSEALAYFIGYEVSVSFYRACVIPLDGEPFLVLRTLDVAP